MRAGRQKAMRLASELTGKGLQRTYEVSGEGVTNRLSTCDECAKSDES